jgi:hypothetical protein
MRWYCSVAVVRACNLTTYSSRRISVLAEIGCREDRIREAIGTVECPQSRFQTVDDITRPSNLGFWLVTIDTSCDGSNSFLEWEALGIHEKDRLLGLAKKRSVNDPSHQAARIHAFHRTVCRARALTGKLLRCVQIREAIDGNWSKPHKASIAGGIRIIRAGIWVSVDTVTAQRRGHGISDVEAGASAAQITIPDPPAVPLHLIAGIEATTLDETSGQAERHRGVVGPLTWQQAKGAATNHIGQWRKRSTLPKFYRSSDGITYRKPQKTAPKPLCLGPQAVIAHG